MRDALSPLLSVPVPPLKGGLHGSATLSVAIGRDAGKHSRSSHIRRHFDRISVMCVFFGASELVGFPSCDASLKAWHPIIRLIRF